MKHRLGSTRSLVRDTSGNILPIAAAGLVVVAGLVGGGVDMSRAYRTQNKLQAACDAGVLAGRRAVTTSGFDQASEDQADDYFDTNFDDDGQGARNTQFAADSADDGNTVTGTASTEIDTTLMRIFGYDEFELSANCQASMGVGNSDVTMVLDTTGSMDWDLPGTSQRRIDALKVAMKNFYDTVHTATASSNARIRYGFVPYSTTVNVGQLIYNASPAYLVDSWQVQSREAVFEDVESQVFTGWDDPVNTTGSGTSSTTNGNYTLYSNTQYNSSSTCSSNLPANTGWSNNGASTTSDPVTTTNGDGQQVVTVTVTQPQRKTEYTCTKVSGKWYRYQRYLTRNQFSYTYATSDPMYDTVTTSAFDSWSYHPVTYDVSTFKTFSPVSVNMGTNGTAISATWEGCIEERETVSDATFSFSSLLGISPDAADLDIDSAPSSTATKWAPMWPEVAYYRTESYYSGGRWRTRMTTTSPTAMGAKASSYCPKPARLLGEMTESQFDTYADALSPEGSTYLDYGILWGARISSPSGIWAANVTDEPTNGATVSRHMIFMTDGEMDNSNSIQAMHGIEYHDRRVTDDGSKSQSDARHTSRFLALCDAVKDKGIRLWVIAFGAALTNDLQSCSSPVSSFAASDASELDDAFQEIAKQVGELRIIQ